MLRISAPGIVPKPGVPKAGKKLSSAWSLMVAPKLTSALFKSWRW